MQGVIKRKKVLNRVPLFALFVSQRFEADNK